MELRKDYFLDRWCVISNLRAARPDQFKKEEQYFSGTDFFAAGNEHLTPPEIGRVPDGNSWKMRWFANKFPAVMKEGNPDIQTHNEFYTFSSGYGTHEIIAETPGTKQLWELPIEDIELLFRVYQHRIEDISAMQEIRYVTVFKNHGREAGASLMHSHSQMVGVNFVPLPIRLKSEKCKNDDPYARIIDKERGSHRRCFENERFIAFTPYCSRFSFEIWVLPTRNIRRMSEFDDVDFKCLADIMQKILRKLKGIGVPYNYYLQYAPEGENMRFHIEVCPRIGLWAGFEYSTAAIINPVSPEEAAAFYRGEA